MCFHRARLTAGETKVAEQPDQSTPAPAHLVLTTSHLSCRHHSQSQRNRKCRNYDWQEDNQRELRGPTAEKEGAARRRFHLEQRRARSMKKKNSKNDVNHICTHTYTLSLTHTVFCCVMFVKACPISVNLQIPGGVMYRKTSCDEQMSTANTCRQISKHLRCVRNPP